MQFVIDIVKGTVVGVLNLVKLAWWSLTNKNSNGE